MSVKLCEVLYNPRTIIATICTIVFTCMVTAMIIGGQVTPMTFITSIIIIFIMMCVCSD